MEPTRFVAERAPFLEYLLELEASWTPLPMEDLVARAGGPAGVAVLIDAQHQCMTTRGVHHRHVSTITTQFTGVFKTDATLRQRFLDFVNRR